MSLFIVDEQLPLKARMGKIVKIGRDKAEYLEKGFTLPKVLPVLLR